MKGLKGIFQSLTVTAILLAGQSAQAAPIDPALVLQQPDIYSSFGNTAYDSTTDIFTVDAFAGSISLDGITSIDLDYFGNFDLDAVITDGGILSSGTITITGELASEGWTSGTLLTGDLTDLGFINDGGQVLGFTFDITGGDLMPAYSGYIYGGIILSVSGYNDDNFNSSFTSAASGSFADTAPVPVPAAIWLFGSGLIGLAGISRRKALA